MSLTFVSPLFPSNPLIPANGVRDPEIALSKTLGLIDEVTHEKQCRYKRVSPHIVQDQALPGVEGDADVPFLPLDQVPLYSKAGPFRLDNVERLQAAAPFLLHQVSVVIDIDVRNAGRDLVLLVNAHNLRNERRSSVLYTPDRQILIINSITAFLT